MPTYSILSWNISLAQPSFSAPDTWKEKDASETRKSIHDEIKAHNPDILALQEIPEANWMPMLISFDEYIPLGPAPSHCGHTALLVRTQYAQQITKVFQVGPSIIALWEQGSQRLSISSSHLYPGPTGAPFREEQFQALLHCHNEYKCTDGIFAGDMNMRSAEDESFEQMKPTLIDAWKEKGTSRNQYTWDTHKNYYREDGYPFRARFDRTYLSTNQLKLIQYKRIGDKALSNPHHFSSDHYGMMVQFHWKTT